MALADVIGSRPPVALLRLVLTAEGVRAEPALPVRRDLQESLQELQVFVEERFAAGRKLLGEVDWRRLLTGAPLTERLLLLTRLTIRGNERVAVPDRAHFRPNDRGLERYAGKFALLPDGTAFSLRLLLEDGQGKKKAGPETEDRPFNSLPDAIQLRACAWPSPRRRGRARRGPTRSSPTGCSRPWRGLGSNSTGAPRCASHVIGLRERLSYNGLADVFTNRKERQKRYDARADQRGGASS